ncbi:hypothetical protein STEG23_028731 [Scotinomys teguina]
MKRRCRDTEEEMYQDAIHALSILYGSSTPLKIRAVKVTDRKIAPSPISTVHRPFCARPTWFQNYNVNVSSSKLYGCAFEVGNNGASDTKTRMERAGEGNRRFWYNVFEDIESILGDKKVNLGHHTADGRKCGSGHEPSLTRHPRLIWNFKSFCLNFQSTGLIGMCHHTSELMKHPFSNNDLASGMVPGL